MPQQTNLIVQAVKDVTLVTVTESIIIDTRLIEGMRSELFDWVGMFDESLPACEDYDLWLRVSCRYRVDLIDEPLIIKRGGHDDQLSRSAGLDKYRIQSLKKIIANGQLSDSQHRAAARTR